MKAIMNKKIFKLCLNLPPGHYFTEFLYSTAVAFQLAVRSIS